MFCPECGKELPHTEAIGTVRGHRPIYEHDCHHPAINVWVYDNEKVAYTRYASRRAALDAYNCTEDDVVNLLEDAVKRTAERLNSRGND